MSDDKLKTFKASARQDKRVSAAKPSRPGRSEPETSRTVGFARFEAILEQESGAAVQARLQTILELLEALPSGSAKERTQGQRARTAIAHTQAILVHLLEVRERLLVGSAPVAAAPSKGRARVGAPAATGAAPAALPAGTAPRGEALKGLVPLLQPDMVMIMEAGYLCLEMGRHREAEEIFVGAGALLPHSEVPLLALGHLFFALNRFAPALKAHQKAAALRPESAAAHAAVGETLFFLRRPEEAKTSLERALSLEPDGATADFVRALQDAQSLGVFQ